MPLPATAYEFRLGVLRVDTGAANADRHQIVRRNHWFLKSRVSALDILLP
ncbi:expressed unknown protein [Ectocarpus siliculosus]|uniref:Uncharacterized protein n=1 Tax=Ectocarpus siliculosus TaxID=2880 RepID=D8LL10_ECTSI|nr:expressed unknown protein [Ectocarpus siliculosus]|eukprot:CBN80143.1 expressed unknown protein [Ectocarpus siliculosus]